MLYVKKLVSKEGDHYFMNIDDFKGTVSPD